MSRWGGDDPRGESSERLRDRPRERASSDRQRDDILPIDRLTLPRGDAREPVEFHGREYSLNGAEVRALHTVGAFRVVSPEAIDDERLGQDVRHGGWRHLIDRGLLTHETVHDRDGSRQVVALTRTGRDLLDAHQPTRSDGPRQEYYAGIAKPRELAHDSRIYDAFREEADQLERTGARITRVVLDYELKRDFQIFLNRDDRPGDADLHADRRDFAESHDLPFHRGHVVFPDLRIEYEIHGRIEHRDVEVVTEHYSRGQLSGKVSFSCHGGGGAKRGGTPVDPRRARNLT